MSARASTRAIGASRSSISTAAASTRSWSAGSSDARSGEGAGAVGAAPDARRGDPNLGEDRVSVLRRTGRPDRLDAQGAGRGASLDRRGALPACAELLHAPARAGGTATRRLYRLADASDDRRADRRPAVRPARRVGDAGAQ